MVGFGWASSPLLVTGEEGLGFWLRWFGTFLPLLLCACTHALSLSVTLHSSCDCE